VVYDDVQYTRRDWRNRNIIKTPDGPQWLTIPVEDSNRDVLIKDVLIKNNGWQERHLESLEKNYKNAPYFNEIMDIMKESFSEEKTSLCKLNMKITQKILDYIGIKSKILYSSEIGFSELHKTDRLVAICKSVGATEYLSGDAAKDYLEKDKFKDMRILWHRYNEKVYPQLWGDFLSRVSIIDTLMNCGMKTGDII